MSGALRRAWFYGAAAIASAGLWWGATLLTPDTPLTFTWSSHAWQLLAPRALRTLALLPVLIAVAVRSLAPLSLPRRSLSVALRCVLLACIAVGLARPVEEAESRLSSTVFAVDVSDSISDEALAHAEAAVTRSLRARGEHHAAVLTFAREAHVVPIPEQGPLKLARHRDGTASDIQEALSLALGLFAPHHLRQVALFSDGLETRGDLDSAASSLTRADVRLFVSDPTDEPPAEVAVEDLVLPSPLKVGEPFTLRVKLRTTVSRSARVRVLQNGLVNGLDGVREVTLSAGETTLDFRSVVGVSGPVHYRVELTPQGPDRFTENNTFSRSTVAMGRPRVLLVEETRAEAAPFAALLQAAGFDADVREPVGLPTSEAELSEYEFVIVSDVPREEFPPAAMQAVESYLEAGGGFMMAGGERSFGLGGYRGSRIENLLPVRLETQRRRDQPSLALMLVIDKSGSMNGEKIELAKEAARATSELLGAEDYLGVIGFDAQPTRVVRLSTAANRVGIAQGIGKLAAGGGTLIFPALDAAYNDLSSVRARIKHVILLTDGQTQENGIPVLVQNMQVDGITVSSIGLGDDVNRSLIEEIARLGHGRAYFTTDPTSVPRLFVRETHNVARSSAVEEYVAAHVQTPADFLRSIPMQQAPLLRGYVATRARPSPAQVILASELGEPLLARMHVGLGWSLAWTSDLKPRWAADWFRWSAHSAFWAQLLREHMRKAPEQSAPLAAHLEGDTLVASLDALDRNERFVNGLTGSLRVRASGGARGAPAELAETPLQQIAPGCYEARFPLPGPGTYTLLASLLRDGEPYLSATSDLAHPFPLEYAVSTPNRTGLRRAAATTGGGPLPDDRDLFAAQGRHTLTYSERWPWFLWAALGLFLLDLLVRRWPGRSSRPTRGAPSIEANQPGEPPKNRRVSPN